MQKRANSSLSIKGDEPEEMRMLKIWVNFINNIEHDYEAQLSGSLLMLSFLREKKEKKETKKKKRKSELKKKVWKKKKKKKQQEIRW